MSPARSRLAAAGAERTERTERPVGAAPARRARAGRGPLAHLRVAGTATAVILLGLSGMGGTFAMWTDQQALDAGTITAGTASLTASPAAGPSGALQDLLPGDLVAQQILLANTGDVPLAVSVTATGTIAGAAHPLRVGPCGGASPAVGPRSLLDLAASGTQDVCVAVVAPAALTPTAAMDVRLQFDGVQIR